MKTKEQIAKYNKEYSARPEVIARAKIRNQKYRLRRKLYKKTPQGRLNENKYRNKRYSQVGFDKHLWARYKITIEDYNKMLKEQDGVCAICKMKSKKKLHVDHCHVFLKVRGLLCGSCNRGLGMFKENPVILQKAINYICFH